MKLKYELEGVEKIFLDTAPIIYFIESHPAYGPLTQEIVKMFSSGLLKAYTSVITLTEVLIKPFELNRMDLVETFKRFILHGRGLELLEINADVAIFAGSLRGRHTYLKAFDAIQLSSAIKAGVDVFVTNDKKLKSFRDIKILCMSDYI